MEKSSNNTLPPPSETITVKKLEETAARIWEVTLEQMYTARRWPEIVEPRYVVFHYRKVHLGHSPRKIVENTPFDKATVYNAIKKVEAYLFSDPVFRQKYYDFWELLRQ